MSLETIDVLLAIVREFEREGSYVFVTTETSTLPDPLSAPTVTLSSDEAFPPLRDVGVRIPYDGIRVLAATSLPMSFGVLSEPKLCTRFYVDGSDFEMRDAIFDQSGCEFLQSLQRTPIVFSGARAQRARISNITVVGTDIAVVIAAGDTSEYTYQPLVDASGADISGVRFLSTTRTYVAAVARAVGEVSVSSCPGTCFVPGPPPPERCIHPGGCLNVTAETDISRGATCCKNSSGLWRVAYAPSLCPGGFMCSYETAETGKADLGAVSNSLHVCNTATCNCGGSGCVSDSPSGGVACTSWDAVLSGDQGWQVSGFDSGFARQPVGLEERYWTLDLSDVRVPEGTRIVTGPRDTKSMYFYVDGDDVVLETSAFFKEAEKRGAFERAYGNNIEFFERLRTERFCAIVNGTRLVLGACSYAWLLDTETRVLQVSGVAGLCPTSNLGTGDLVLAPCATCNYFPGEECPRTVAVSTQFFSSGAPAGVCDNSTGCSAQGVPSDAVLFGTPDLGLYLNATDASLCWTEPSGQWEPCDPCGWQALRLASKGFGACDLAQGIQQTACSPSGGHLIGVSGGFCADGSYNVSGELDGRGSTVVCLNGRVSVERPGYGYRLGEVLDAGAAGFSGVAEVPELLVQPLNGTSFSVRASGVTVVNVSAYTGLFGARVEKSLYRTQARHRASYIVANVFLGVANAAVVVCHIVLLYVGQEQRERLLRLRKKRQ